MEEVNVTEGMPKEVFEAMAADIKAAPTPKEKLLGEYRDLCIQMGDATYRHAVTTEEMIKKMKEINQTYAAEITTEKKDEPNEDQKQ